MTKPKTYLDLGLLTALVQDIGDRLNLAEADVALLQRLKGAEPTALRLRDELADAQSKLSLAMTNAVTEQRKALYSNFKDIRVSVAIGEGQSNNALSNRYTITITRMAYDSRTRQSDWVDTVTEGFGALDADARGYLMEVRPDALPAIIMDLAPGDPATAMGLYYRGMQRGFIAA